MFPRRVPSLNTQLEIHSTGLTDPQMIALMALVNQILPDFVYHSRKITVVLYEKYPQYLKTFRQTPRDNQHLHEHSAHVLRFFTTLIESGLNNLDLYKQMLDEFVKQHRSHGLDHTDIQNITEVYEEYFRKALTRYMSITLDEAIDIFFRGVVAAFHDTAS